MSSSKRNPDTRPLPAGWRQHYDSERDVWYYIDLDTSPPFASYVHPADTLACLANLSSSSSSGSGSSSSGPPRSRSGSLALASTPASSSATTSPSLPSKTPQHVVAGSTAALPADTPILDDDGMTYAQRLYASSMRNINMNSGGRSSLEGQRPSPSPRGSLDLVRDSSSIGESVTPGPSATVTTTTPTSKPTLPLQDVSRTSPPAPNTFKVISRGRSPPSRKGTAQGSVITSLTPAALAIHNRATSPLAMASTAPTDSTITPSGDGGNTGGDDKNEAAGSSSSPPAAIPTTSLYNPHVVASPLPSGASNASRTFPVPIGPRAPLNRRGSYASAKSIDITKPSTPSPQFQTATSSTGGSAAPQAISLNRRALPSLPLGTASSDSSVMIVSPLNNNTLTSTSAPSTRGAFNGVGNATANNSRQKAASIPLSYPAITEDNILFAPPQTQSATSGSSSTVVPSTARRRGEHQRVGSLPLVPNTVPVSSSPIFLPHPQDDSADALTSVQPVAATGHSHSHQPQQPQHHHSSLTVTRQTRSHTVSELPRHLTPSPSASATAPSTSDHLVIFQPKPIRPLKGANRTLQDRLTTTPPGGMTLEGSSSNGSVSGSDAPLPPPPSNHIRKNADQSPSGGLDANRNTSNGKNNSNTKTPFLHKLGVIIGARP